MLTSVIESKVGDPALDLYGVSDRDVIHFVHHGSHGGVYKAWAKSEAAAHELVQQLTRLQAALLEAQSSLKARKDAAKRAKARNHR